MRCCSYPPDSSVLEAVTETYETGFAAVEAEPEGFCLP